MHMHDILDDQIRKFRAAFRHPADMYGPLHILEVGSIRQDTEQHRLGDGWSTLRLAEYAAAEGGRLTSIDLDPSVARTVVRRHNLMEHVRFVEGYSIVRMGELLAAGAQFDVILLDSENDDTLTLHEFMLARSMRRPHCPSLILVDDVVPGSDTQIKGRKLLPWIEGRTPASMPWQPTVIPRTGDGFMSGVLSVVA